MLPVGGEVAGYCVYCISRFFGQQSLISVGLYCQDSTPWTHMFSVSNRCLISQAGRRRFDSRSSKFWLNRMKGMQQFLDRPVRCLGQSRVARGTCESLVRDASGLGAQPGCERLLNSYPEVGQ